MSESSLRILKIIVLIFLGFIFAFKIFTFIDPDLGWHLRAGEIIAQTGHAPIIDPWTYTMTGHEWIDHEWLLDAAMWWSRNNDAWFFVGSIFLLSTFIPFFFWVRKIRYFTEIIFILLAGFMMLSITGIRPQIFSFFLFFILWEILRNRYIYETKSKTFFVIPFIFLLWANIHAGFVAGLVIFGFTVFFQIYKNTRQNPNFSFFKNFHVDLFVLIASCAATLCTPYGIDLWLEVYRSTFTPLIGEIGEWKSAFISWGVIYPLFIGLIAGLIFALRSKLNKLEICIVIFFILLSAKHARMLPMLLVVAMPLIASLHTEFYKLLHNISDVRLIKRVVFPTTILVFVIMFFATIKSENILKPYHPPFDAIKIESIFHKISGGNTFNDYNFGGAMIFYDPSRKLFIDGRLPHWKGADGYSAFQNYLDVIYVSEEWKRTFARYDIQIVILSNVHEERINAREIFNQVNVYPPILQKILYFILPSKVPLLLPELLENGWCRVYRDDEATILASPGTSLCKQKTTL